MRVQFSIEVGGEPVGLSLHLLDADESERTAAAIAWFTLQAISGEPPQESWRQFVQEVILEHVEFTISEEKLAALGQAWWSEAAGRAAAEFIQLNELGPSLRRHLRSL